MAKSKIVLSFAIATSLLAGGASYMLRMKHATPGGVVVRFDSLPLAFGPYRGQELRFSDETYDVLSADTSTLRRYMDEQGWSTWLFVAYFGEQNYGEQIHSPRNCLPGGGWDIRSLDRVSVSVPGRDDVRANRLIIERDGTREIMYYFFLTRIGSVASEYRLKLLLAQSALTFRPRDALFVRVTSPIGPDGAGAVDRRINAFLAACLPPLARGLPF